MNTKIGYIIEVLIALFVSIVLILSTSAVIYMLVSLLNYCSSIYIGFIMPQWLIILYSALLACFIFGDRVDKKW